MNNFFDNPEYRILKTVMQVLGLWPYQKFSTRVIILTIWFCDMTSAAIPMVWYFVEEFTNTAEMVNCLPALFITQMAYIALTITIANSKKFKTILDFMKETHSILQNEEEKIIFKKYAKIGQLVAEGIFVLAGAAAIFFTNVPLLTLAINVMFAPNESRPMETILKANFYNLDPDKYYIPIYLYSFQVVYPLVYMTVVYNLYFVVVINHACGMFAVLSRRIENVGLRNRELYDTVSSHKLDNILSNEIAMCINYHWICIRFSQLIENSLTYYWLMELFGNAFMISIMSVQTIVNFGKPFYMISFATNTSGITVQLFCLTWASQQLLDHSHQLGETIYNIDWYEFPPRSRKLLLIMLLRSSRPCKITAGRMVELNLETFCRFLKMSTSYFTLVLSTQ